MSQTAVVLSANLENQIASDASKVAVQQAAIETLEQNAGQVVQADRSKKRLGLTSARAKGTPKTTNRIEPSKAEIVLKKLRLTRGVTGAQIVEVTGWQPHSVRSFLSAVVKKKLGLNLVSDIGKDGQRRYRIIDDGSAKAAE